MHTAPFQFRSPYLQLAFPGLGSLLEDVQNEGSAITNMRLVLKQLGQIPQLPWRQFTIEDDSICSIPISGPNPEPSINLLRRPMLI
jgi:hypothetical protein